MLCCCCFPLGWGGGVKERFSFSTPLYSFFILGDPGAESRGERQIKRAKSVRPKVYKAGEPYPGCQRFFPR